MLNREQTDGNRKEEVDERWGLSARKMFQVFGTDIFRNRIDDFFPELSNLKNNFWIYRFKLWYKQLIENNPSAKVVVTDVRFLNEAEAIRELGGTIIKVTRTGTKSTDMHESEKNIDMITGDINISNDTTVGYYQTEVENYIVY